MDNFISTYGSFAKAANQLDAEAQILESVAVPVNSLPCCGAIHSMHPCKFGETLLFCFQYCSTVAQKSQKEAGPFHRLRPCCLKRAGPRIGEETMYEKKSLSKGSIAQSSSFCKRCGEKLPKNAVFCPYCGVRQVPAPRAHKGRARGNGMGTVYQRPDKTWTACITLAYIPDPETGTVKRKTRSKRGFATKREALEYLPQLKAQPVEVPKDITFAKLYEMWYPTHEGKVGKSTMDCYKAAYKHFEPIWYVKMSDLKTAGLQACLDGLGKRTQQNMKALGTQLYRYAQKNDLVSKNYAELLDVGGETQEPREPFTMDEIKIMWNSYKVVPNLDLVLIMCYTGFRLHEFLSLTGSDLHHERLDGEEWYYFVGGEKTQAGKNRIVPISPKILPLVLNHEKPGYLFSPTEKQIDDKRFRETIYYPALQAAGLPQRVPHCCRHTYATLLKNLEGVSDKDKMESIGHSSMEMTNHYTHADKVSLKRLGDSLP